MEKRERAKHLDVFLSTKWNFISNVNTHFDIDRSSIWKSFHTMLIGVIKNSLCRVFFFVHCYGIYFKPNPVELLNCFEKNRLVTKNGR